MKNTPEGTEQEHHIVVNLTGFVRFDTCPAKHWNPSVFLNFSDSFGLRTKELAVQIALLLNDVPRERPEIFQLIYQCEDFNIFQWKSAGRIQADYVDRMLLGHDAGFA